jgi:hypothetical protein
MPQRQQVLGFQRPAPGQYVRTRHPTLGEQAVGLVIASSRDNKTYTVVFFDGSEARIPWESNDLLQLGDAHAMNLTGTSQLPMLPGALVNLRESVQVKQPYSGRGRRPADLVRVRSFDAELVGRVDADNWEVLKLKPLDDSQGPFAAVTKCVVHRADVKAAPVPVPLALSKHIGGLVRLLQQHHHHHHHQGPAHNQPPPQQPRQQVAAATAGTAEAGGQCEGEGRGRRGDGAGAAGARNGNRKGVVAASVWR